MARKSAGRKAEKSSSSGRRGGGRARRGGDSDERKSDYRQKVDAAKVEQAGKKGGCVPKLFMLLLPFVAVGAYFLLRA